MTSPKLREEIIEQQRLAKAFNETELGALFNKFVSTHARAWQEDERSAWMETSGKTAKRLFDESDELENKLRKILMEMVGVK